MTRRKATEALMHRVGNYPDLSPEMPRYCSYKKRSSPEISPRFYIFGPKIVMLSLKKNKVFN